MSIKIYHNPRCSKSRQTLQLLEENGVEPEIVEYPAFTLADLEGEQREFSEFNGRHRMLNFWATWCAPCRREIPLLKEFQSEQDEDGILVMGIAVDFAEEVAAQLNG